MARGSVRGEYDDDDDDDDDDADDDDYIMITCLDGMIFYFSNSVWNVLNG